jgi:DNA-binding beta-propeller fold protein YncE
VKARIQTGQGPDSAAYDPATKLAFVMNSESSDVTVIDPIKAVPVGSIALGGHPEAAVADGRGHLFVNVEDRDEIADIDVGARKVIGRYKLPGCHEPTGIAFDALTGVLISACRNKVAKLIDAVSGADRGTLQIGEGADGAIFDARRRQLYIPSNEGLLSIFKLAEDGEVQTLQAVKTERYARTAALDEETGKLYLPADQRTEDAAHQLQQVPNTFHVLVVAPD